MILPQSASGSCVRVRSGAPPPKVWLHSAKRLIARLRPLDGVGPCDGCEEHCEKLSFMAAQPRARLRRVADSYLHRCTCSERFGVRLASGVPVYGGADRVSASNAGVRDVM